MRFEEGPALKWLRLIVDNAGWMDEDERVMSRELEAPYRIPRRVRRHLVRLGYVRDTVYSDGSWRLDATEIGRRARVTETIV